MDVTQPSEAAMQLVREQFENLRSQIDSEIEKAFDRADASRHDRLESVVHSAWSIVHEVELIHIARTAPLKGGPRMIWRSFRFSLSQTQEDLWERYLKQQQTGEPDTLGRHDSYHEETEPWRDTSAWFLRDQVYPRLFRGWLRHEELLKDRTLSAPFAIHETPHRTVRFGGIAGVASWIRLLSALAKDQLDRLYGSNIVIGPSVLITGDDYDTLNARFDEIPDFNYAATLASECEAEAGIREQPDSQSHGEALPDPPIGIEDQRRFLKPELFGALVRAIDAVELTVIVLSDHTDNSIGGCQPLEIGHPAFDAVSAFLDALPETHCIRHPKGQRHFPPRGGVLWSRLLSASQSETTDSDHLIELAIAFIEWAKGYYRPKLAAGEQQHQGHVKLPDGSLKRAIGITRKFNRSRQNLTEVELAAFRNYVGIKLGTGPVTVPQSFDEGMTLLQWQQAFESSELRNAPIDSPEFRNSVADAIPAQILMDLAKRAGLTWPAAQRYSFLQLLAQVLEHENAGSGTHGSGRDINDLPGDKFREESSAQQRELFRWIRKAGHVTVDRLHSEFPDWAGGKVQVSAVQTALRRLRNVLDAYGDGWRLAGSISDEVWLVSTSDDLPEN